jgi:transcriptional regulator with XRE-family HTH domain
MNRIRELRLDNNMTMRKAAEVLKMPYTTYVNYEKGLREPNSEVLIKIAKYYHVTVDYLVGNVSDPNFRLDNNAILADINRYENEEAPAVNGKRSVSDEEIKFALFGGDGEITDAMYEEVKKFAAFVKQREADKKKE